MPADKGCSARWRPHRTNVQAPRLATESTAKSLDTCPVPRRRDATARLAARPCRCRRRTTRAPFATEFPLMQRLLGANCAISAPYSRPAWPRPRLGTGETDGTRSPLARIARPGLQLPRARWDRETKCLGHGGPRLRFLGRRNKVSGTSRNPASASSTSEHSRSNCSQPGSARRYAAGPVIDRIVPRTATRL